MPPLEVLAAFFGAALLLSIAPGPDNIFVLTQSALYGARAGMTTTLGLVTGLVGHTLAVALGIAALLKAFPLAFTLLKTCGAAYLIWLAWLSLRAKAATAESSGRSAFPGYPALYRRGVVMNITNPKVALFFLAFLPQFCVPSGWPMSFQIVLFGALFMLATIVVFFAVAALGGRLALLFNRSPNAQVFIHRVAAAVFVGLAVALFLADASDANVRACPVPQFITQL